MSDGAPGRPAGPSVLYGLGPLGAGTPAVESLTGYVARLAGRHLMPVGAMVSAFVLPAVSDATGPAGVADFALHDATTIDGVGPAASRWAAALGSLTLRPDLGATTLAPWAAVLSPRALLRRSVAWCPACLRTDDERHERLLWRVASAAACPVHRTRLRDRCPSCGEGVPALAYRAEAGACRRCGADLGAAEDGPEASGRDLARARAIGELLASPPAGPPSVEAFVAALEGALARAGLSGNAAARALGMSRGSMSEWRAGAVRPSLETLLRIATLLRVSPRGLLAGRVEPWHDAPEPDGASAFPSPARVDWEGVRCRLEAEVASPAPTSLAAFARASGVHPQDLRRRFPALARSLVARGRDLACVRRDARLAEARGLVEDAVAALVTAGLFPSRRRVEAALGGRFSVREPAIRDLWVEAVGRAATP